MSAAGDEELRKQARGYFIRGQMFGAPALPAGLYVVATPIGNLSDISIRALDTLAAADLVACEDTRVTRKLLTRYGIKARIVSYHEHSGPRDHRRLLDTLREGRSIALASDAGTPLISDPGALLVADAIEAGFAVVPIPGPSSVMAALSAAGVAADAVLFLGFLPAKSGARMKRLTEVAPVQATLVLFESPNRIAALLADATAAFGGERSAVVCRELTKLHETFDRGSLQELAGRYQDTATKGEIVLVVAPPGEAKQPPMENTDALLLEALRSMSVKEAAAAVADATGMPRRALYQRALKLKGGDGS
jgi:16S rRNA (cytidine1402-2'-O)-methyltransferase